MTSKPKKIAIIGASYLQLPLVLRANELGYETFCFSFLDGAVCEAHCTEFYPISVIEKEEILAICRELEIDGITSIASDLVVPTINYISNSLGLNGNTVASSELCTNKFVMKETLSAAGLNVARFITLRSTKDLVKVKNLSYPLIVKPVDRSGSLGVTKILSSSDLEFAFAFALSTSLVNQVIVEEFIVGDEISVESISIFGEHYQLATTDKVTSGAPHFVELEHHEPSSLSKELLAEIHELIPKALDVLKIKNSASHSELIITAQGKVYINEIGARMGGDFIGSHLVQLTTGYDYLQGVIETSLGIAKAPLHSLSKSAGVVFYSTENEAQTNHLDPSAPYVIKHEITGTKTIELTKSADRHGYLIYQSEKRIIFENK
ncbi:MAG: biotin carboxylase [Flavobacteriaceae bacterium]|jgi:biotin carboxylase